MHYATAPEVPRFQQLQRQFTAHLRRPHSAPAPQNVAPRCLALYRELFFNNVVEQLSSVFPVMRSVIKEERWQQLCADFFAEHHCTTPLFHQLPQEFLQWLDEELNGEEYDQPYLQELAHYEWAELALAISEAELPPVTTLPEAELEWTPHLSPLAWPLAYHYPVHRITAAQSNVVPQPTWLLVYRDRRDQIGFMELTPISARLLQLLTTHEGNNVAELLASLAGELGHHDPAQLYAGAVPLLRQLHQQHILY